MAKGPLHCCLFNGQVDLLAESLVVGKDRSVLSDFLNLPVQALDGIRLINERPDLLGIPEECDDLILVSFCLFKKVYTVFLTLPVLVTVNPDKLVYEVGIMLAESGTSFRVDLELTLGSLKVNSVPLSFRNPILGTPLENSTPDSPLMFLKSIVLFGFVRPDTEIQICGGREANFRSLQSAILLAAASGMMIGNYLTTTG